VPATARLQLEEMYALAHFLHYDLEVALMVTLAAADRLTLLRRQLAPPVRRLPDAWPPQYCVYLASDTHERAYEHQRPGRSTVGDTLALSSFRGEEGREAQRPPPRAADTKAHSARHPDRRRIYRTAHPSRSS
jgi:hypothetical protein